MEKNIVCFKKMHKILQKLDRIERSLDSAKDLNAAEGNLVLYQDVADVKTFILDNVKPEECTSDETKGSDGKCYTKEEFEVNKILASKGSGDKEELLVGWKGYPKNTDFSWQTVKHLKEGGGPETDMTEMFLNRKKEILDYLSKLTPPEKQSYLLSCVKKLGHNEIRYNSEKRVVTLRSKLFNGRTKNLEYTDICGTTQIRVVNPANLDQDYFVLKAAVAVLNPGFTIIDNNGEQTTDECIANILELQSESSVLEPLKKDCELEYKKGVALIPKDMSKEKAEKLIGKMLQYDV